ncbi:hypothetical protein [Stutzerimonas azotifigens]|nr:hypothetical protein [Stutzerimonas azotifigens]
MTLATHDGTPIGVPRPPPSVSPAQAGRSRRTTRSRPFSGDAEDER